MSDGDVYFVCVSCAIKIQLSVRELIGHAIRPFTAETLCWCDQDPEPFWERIRRG